MSIHIVTHCYAIALPQYAVHLNYQLSSLVRWQPNVPVSITVCMSIIDHRVHEVLNWFADHTDLTIHTLAFDHRHLFRRSIGRNRAAHAQPNAELTWFTDVDHVFGDGCLDRLWSIYTDARTKYDTISLLYPKSIQIHTEHAIGDALVDSEAAPGLVELDTTTFTTKHYSRAIGGIQIVPQWYLRQYGYLHKDAKYQSPVDADKPFACFRDDVAFRSGCHARGRVLPIELPSLYRIRHTKTTYQGQDHGTVAVDQSEG